MILVLHSEPQGHPLKIRNHLWGHRGRELCDGPLPYVSSYTTNRSRPRILQELLQSLQMKMFTCENTYLFGHIFFVAEASETFSTNEFIRCNHSWSIYNLLGPTHSIYSILKIPYEFVDKRILMSMLQARKL